MGFTVKGQPEKNENSETARIFAQTADAIEQYKMTRERGKMLTLKWFDEPKLVKVYWDDTTNLATWHSRSEIEEHWEGKPFLCENVGYLIATDGTGAYYIASRVGRFNEEEDAWGLIERIPKGVIWRVVDLKEDGGVVDPGRTEI